MQFSNIGAGPACWVRRRTKDEQFMADGEFDWLPGAGGAAWTLREAAPCDACVTRYDQEHFLTYARLIDAQRFGNNRREADSQIPRFNVGKAPNRTTHCWQEHHPPP